MRNKQENGRTLDPRMLVVKEERDLECADSIAPDLQEAKRQFRAYADQIVAIVQQNKGALAAFLQNAAPVVGGKDCRLQIEEEMSIIVRL